MPAGLGSGLGTGLGGELCGGLGSTVAAFCWLSSMAGSKLPFLLCHSRNVETAWAIAAHFIPSLHSGLRRRLNLNRFKGNEGDQIAVVFKL